MSPQLKLKGSNSTKNKTTTFAKHEKETSRYLHPMHLCSIRGRKRNYVKTPSKNNFRNTYIETTIKTKGSVKSSWRSCASEVPTFYTLL